ESEGAGAQPANRQPERNDGAIRTAATGDLVGTTEHLHGDDALVGQPARYRRLRRAALRSLPADDGYRSPRSGRGNPLPRDRLAEGRGLADRPRSGGEGDLLPKADGAPPAAGDGGRLAGRAVQRLPDPRPARDAPLPDALPLTADARRYRLAAAG